MLVNREQIHDIIPQRDPITLIHRLKEQEEQFTVCEFDVEEGHLFVENGSLKPAGLVENIAQTAAGRMGYHYMQKNEKPPVGFIGAVSKLEIHDRPTVGETVTTKVSIKSEVFNITLITGESFVGDRKLANCEMKIVINEEA